MFELAIALQATGLPRRRRRKSPPTATRDLIVQVTEHAIFELGMARVTIRRIATSAGISEGTIFRHFATKDELVLAALKRRNASRATTLDAVAHLDGTVLENITRTTKAILRYYDGVLSAAIAAMADTSLLPRHREWLLQPNGRKLHPAYLFEVKKPSESKGPWDYYNLVAAISAEEAFLPLEQSTCSLLKK